MALTELSFEYGEITDKNVLQFKKLNETIFPVRYSDKFYTDILSPDNKEFTKLILHNDVVIGGMACKVETDTEKRLYIMTLGILAPYRNYKIGSKALQKIINAATQRPELVAIHLHVQVNNDDAVKFYKKFGFEIHSTVEKYYNRIEPSSAYILRKNLK